MTSETDVPKKIATLAAYWNSLADGAAPERSALDLAPIALLLPYLLLIEFEADPFRVRYRLTGTKVDEMTGINITGRHLDEFAHGAYREPVLFIQGCYARCRDSGTPVIETYLWPNDRDMSRLVWMGLFPLKIEGEIRQCLSIEDYGPLGPNPEPIDWRAALT